VSTYIPETLKAQIEECDSEALRRSADRHRCWGKGSEAATKCHMMAETLTGTGTQKSFWV